jgi:hypothetical protein
MMNMTATRETTETATDWADHLRTYGFCVIPDLLPQTSLGAMDAALSPLFDATPFCRGGFYGERTKRFGRLLIRGVGAEQLVAHPLILAIAETILGEWCDTIQLNLTQAIEIHPGELAQVPHRDQDMWHAQKGRLEYVINVMWPLTRFRAENGATRIWPRSHGQRALDDQALDDPIAAECAPGGAILFLGSTLHSGGANRTGHPRRGIVTGYSLGWLKAYENPFLAYPPEIARSFSPELAALVGYRQHRPNLGNYEGQCPSILLAGAAPVHLAATDALLPGQAAMINAYQAEELRKRTDVAS